MLAGFILVFLHFIIPYFCHITLWQSYINFLNSPQYNRKLLLKEEILDKYFTSRKDKCLEIHSVGGILNIGHQNGHFRSKEPVLVLLAKCCCWELLIICYQSFFPKATYCKIPLKFMWTYNQSSLTSNVLLKYSFDKERKGRNRII